MRFLSAAGAVFLCSCLTEGPSRSSGERLPGPAKDSGEAALPAPLIPEAYLKSGGRLISLSEGNRQLTSLKLDDGIVFSDFSQSPLFSWKISKSQKAEDQKAVFQDLEALKIQDLKMKVFSSCSSSEKAKKKIVREKGSSQYQSHFSILELLPEGALLSGAEDPLSCDFIFILKDINSAPHQYTLAQQLIPLDTGSKDLFLIRAERGQWEESSRDLETIADLRQTFLMSGGGAPIESIRFICEGWSHQAKFSFSDLGSRPVFMNLLSVRDHLPRGKRLCRILSEGKAASVNGATKPFYINFDSLKKQKTLDISKITVLPIADSGSGREGRPSEKVFLSGAFRLTGLPEDFRPARAGLGPFYEPVEIHAKTSCSGSVFRNGSFEKAYSFPLTPEFSLMSVSPEELFQFDYSHLYWKGRLMENAPAYDDYFSDDEVERAARKSRKRRENSASCAYQISLKKPWQKGRNSILPQEIYPLSISWDGKGYGVEASDKTVKIREIKSERYKKNSHFSLTFMSRPARENPAYDSGYPDEMVLRCGRKGRPSSRDKSAPELELYRQGGKIEYRRPLILSWPFRQRGFARIPYSAVFDHEEVIEHKKFRVTARCRLLFYREGVLKYFSREIALKN